MDRASGKVIAAIGLLLATLAGCAHRPAALADAPAPAAAPPPRPVLAANYLGVIVPPVDAGGHYRTINAGIGEQQTIWHVRAALNVAAIGCRGPDNAAIVAAYNSLLGSKKALLASANKAVEAQYRAQGSGWQDAHDRYMTRLYNFFSMPQASAGFCHAAATLAPRAAAADAAGFPAFAQTALLELEAPMIAVYQSIDAWKVQVADWDAHYGPNAPKPAQLAAAAPAADPGATRDAPRLRYDKLSTVLAWEPLPGQRMAMR